MSQLETRIKSSMAVTLDMMEGDVLMWIRWDILTASPSITFQAIDLWRHSHGDQVNITTSAKEVPVWFQFHATERSHGVSLEMMANLCAGIGAEEIQEGPNIWRVCAGDRIIWTGCSREPSKETEGWVHVYSFDENALVTGTPLSLLDSFPIFGMKAGQEFSSEQLQYAKAGIAYAKKLGAPSIISADSHWWLT